MSMMATKNKAGRVSFGWSTLLWMFSAMARNQGRSCITTVAAASFQNNPSFLSQTSSRQQHHQHQRHYPHQRQHHHTLDTPPLVSIHKQLLFTTIPKSTKQSSTTRTSLGMFTGIVEEMGTVVSLEEQDRMTMWDGSTGTGTELVIQGKTVLEGAYLGCSICVSGVCLTATALDLDHSQFKVGLAPETLRRTYFGSLRPGDQVNLERASEIGGRNSGHFVQGHVDGTGTIVQQYPDEDSLWFQVAVAPEVLKYIVPKGFVAVDGTSLTVVDVNTKEGWFSFMLVDYTQKHVILPSKQVGDLVNIEVDVLGKYSESALAALIPRLEALEAKVESLERQLNANK